MAMTFQTGWSPAVIRRIEECQDTGSEVVAVVTNEGRGFAKFLGNREGPHVLACEFLGTRLAHHLGLPVFDHALMDYDGVPEIILYHGNRAESGPTWVTRREEGVNWSGHAGDLKLIDNSADVAKLVALDTWILNCDRYRPEPRRVNRNNVFFSREGAPSGQFRLVAMDFTHAFTCGRSLKPELSTIDFIKNDMLFGLFPEFEGVISRAAMVTACEALAAVSDGAIRDEIARLPHEWQVDRLTREALATFLCQRRDFVASSLVVRIFPQSELNL